MKREEIMYIAIDLKSFFASGECVERGLDPLKAHLVGADESRTDKTICLAVSPALKEYGIPGRPRLFEVRQKLMEYKARTGKEVDFIIAKPQMAKYLKASGEVYATYLKYVSHEDIHTYSIDECFMDVTHYLDMYKMTAKELAGTIIRDVLQKTGITATAGIGTNLYLCKIAMDIVAKHMEADSDGVRIASLNEMEYRRMLWGHKPITDFWRVGRGIASRLKQAGIYTMGDIARTSVYNEDILYKMFGIDAEILIDHAWGYEPCTIKEIKSYRTDTSSLSSGQVLQRPYTFEEARLVVKEMTDVMVLDMVDKGVASSSFTLTVGYDRENVDTGAYRGEVEIDIYGRKLPKPAHGTANVGTTTNSTRKITEAVMELYDRIVSRKLYIRRIQLNANNLVGEGYEQFDLFTDPDEIIKEKNMQKTMLDIKKKYGKNSILKGMNLEKGATGIDRNNQIGGHKA